MTVLIRILKGVALVVVLLACGVGVLLAYLYPFWGKAFSRETWNEAGRCLAMSGLDCLEQDARRPRCPMVFSLTWFHLEPGRTTRQHVVELLGKGREIREGSDSCLTYPLGMCQGREGYDHELLVCFDSKDAVKRARHVEG